MTQTAYYAHAGDDRIPVGRRDAAYLSRAHGVRVSAVTRGGGDG